MHTGVWIMLYPWGKWPEQPSDWEMYHHIRDEVNSTFQISLFVMLTKDYTLIVEPVVIMDME
ncbi:MAG: hypothetical protein Ct9H90mP14_0200 [Methanobacteriota archaeon]|nr:MAG: hypothetical protein Ct9H90mP14_0200 [Euryarchaeota archaeon]